MTATLTNQQYAEQFRAAALNNLDRGECEEAMLCISTYWKISTESRADDSCGKETDNDTNR